MVVITNTVLQYKREIRLLKDVMINSDFTRYINTQKQNLTAEDSGKYES
jgi:hypothetical protein